MKLYLGNCEWQEKEFDIWVVCFEALFLKTVYILGFKDLIKHCDWVGEKYVKASAACFLATYTDHHVSIRVEAAAS